MSSVCRSTAYAQHPVSGKCGVQLDRALQASGITKEEYLRQFQVLVERYTNQLSIRTAKVLDDEVYRVPIVCHVLYYNSDDDFNISKEQILRQIDILNQAFSATHEDISHIPDIYQDVHAGNTYISFHLAQKDPYGLPTDGVVRRAIPSSFRVDSNNLKDDLNSVSPAWDTNQYLNVWILPENSLPFIGFASLPIVDITSLSLGQTHPHSNSHRKLSDIESKWGGIYVATEAFSAGYAVNSLSNATEGKTMIHEVGHYLGLLHVWGDGDCTRDDFCEDTPYSNRATYDCEEEKVTCNSRDMVENYMDYSADPCLVMFTKCQRLRMRATLAVARKLLHTSEDKITPLTLRANDLGIATLDSVSIDFCGKMNGKIVLGNYSTHPIHQFRITPYIDDSSLADLSFNKTIQSGDTAEISFVLPSVSSGTHSLSVEIVEVNETVDSYVPNNKRSTYFFSPKEIMAPHTEDFEHIHLRDWFVSEPLREAVDIVKDQHNQGNMLEVALTRTSVSSFAQSYEIMTPVYDFSSLTSQEVPHLSFRYNFQGAASQTLSELQMFVYYKTSEGCQRQLLKSASYTLLGIDTYTSIRQKVSERPVYADDWRSVSLPLGSLSLTHRAGLLLKVRNGRNGNLYIDDMTLTKQARTMSDLSIVECLTPLMTCSSTLSSFIVMTNDGSITVDRPDIFFSIENRSLSQRDRLVMGRLLPYTVRALSYSFNLQLQSGGNLVTIHVPLSGDEEPSNNSIARYVYYRDTQSDVPSEKESFESGILEASKWMPATSIENVDDWQRTSLGYAQAPLFNNPNTGTAYKLISPIYPGSVLMDKKELTLSFQIGYAYRESLEDRLQLLAFIDCIPVPTAILYDKSGDALSVRTSSSAWSPTQDTDWRTETVDLSQFAGQEKSLLLMFVASNAGGNHISIDNIQLHDTLTPFQNPDSPPKQAFTLYPNPVDQYEEFHIVFELAVAQDLYLSIIDVSGRQIWQNVYTQVPSGQQRLTVSPPISRAEQLYILRLKGKTLDEQVQFIYK